MDNCDLEYTRYFRELAAALESVGGKIEGTLRLEYEYDYQGFVDIDVLLEDGRVFSYYYSYGSCSGCDDWEYRDLSSDEITSEMVRDATIFDNLGQYNTWRASVDKPK